MKSRNDDHTIEDHQIDAAIRWLEPLILTASITNVSDPLGEVEGAPTDRKGNPLLRAASFDKDGVRYELFIHPERVHDRPDAQCLRRIEQSKLSDVNPVKYIKSLPIWEEIVHRDTPLHRKIVDASNGHPWTLYKLAKKEMANPVNDPIVIGGYPQWLVNSMDYRKIASLNFICSYIQEYPSIGLYYFEHPESKEIEVFRQKF